MDPITCTRCDGPIPTAYYNTPDFFPCPSCGASLKVEAFPAVLRGTPSGETGISAVGDEASCFFHAKKRADSTCDYCGRFLCSLCDIELNGEHLCPACLDTGRRRGRLENLDRTRTLHDSTALGVAVLPLMMVWPTLITAPVGLYLAIRHWKSPLSMVRRRKTRLVAAIAISGVEILAWVFVITYLIVQR